MYLNPSFTLILGMSETGNDISSIYISSVRFLIEFSHQSNSELKKILGMRHIYVYQRFVDVTLSFGSFRVNCRQASILRLVDRLFRRIVDI